MPFLAADGHPTFHLPEGLWPVYVAVALGIGCVVAIGVVHAYFLPALRRYPGAPRSLLAIAGASFVAAAALYVYADGRYEDCLAAGNHPWWFDQIEPGRAVCDRAVLGDVVVWRRSQ